MSRGQGMQQSIDAVYTWVDCNDSQWAAEFNKYKSTSNLTSSTHNMRFRDYGEIVYSLLSIEKFAPWIEKIFIIKKPYQFPKIDSLSQATKEKIIWIDDTELCPPDISVETFYPTFNSLAIEANLHRIPGLNEQFIYFNNDMFLGSPLNEEYFFKNNQARFAVYTKIIHHLIPKPLITGHDRHYLNTKKIFETEYTKLKNLGNSPFHFPVHQCTPVFKSSYQQLWENPAIKRELLSTSRSRFRTNDNLHSIFLSCFLNLYFKRAYLIQEADHTFDLSSRYLENHFNNIKRKRPARFCIHDDLKVDNKNIRIFHSMMRDLYMQECHLE